MEQLNSDLYDSTNKLNDEVKFLQRLKIFKFKNKTY